MTAIQRTINRDEVLAKVRALLAKKCRCDSGLITEDTRLLQDLELDGDDAEEFIDTFSREFGVDMSSFCFEEYFGPEVSCRSMLSVLTMGIIVRNGEKQPLTVGHLVNAVTNCRW